MTKTIFDTSMSLNGFMTASNQAPEEPLGRRGLRLHAWVFGSDEPNQRYLVAAIEGQGAAICGRRTYDTSRWGGDGPTGSARRPASILAHQAPTESPAGCGYTFVADGLVSALNQATDAAGDKDACVTGSGDLGRQYIVAGLVDELSIHLVPVLFGAGTRVFDDRPGYVHLEAVDVLPTPTATHLRHRIVR